LDKALSASLSQLHRSTLKPLGFLKRAGTFTRSNPDFIELFNIQSSNGNGPWGRCFYVNCGVKFNDLPLEVSWLYFPGTQWACRIQHLVPGLTDQWQYDETNLESVMDTLGKTIPLASIEMSKNLRTFRDQYFVRLQGMRERVRAAKA